jgi:sulfite exporter TauE/SafE
MNTAIAALLFGLAGSLHCLGMCGPLVLAVHTSTPGKSISLNKILYHLGRLLVYGILGALAGIVGEAASAFGWQQGLAILAGIVMLLLVLWPDRFKQGPFKLIALVKQTFSKLLQSKSYGTHLLLGMLNGMLPCGLVYMALAAALATGSLSSSISFMLFFGVGTAPALLAAGSLLGYLSRKLKGASMKYLQVTLIGVSMLLVLRGANLGIPYLSPKLTSSVNKAQKVEHQMDCCHKPKH